MRGEEREGGRGSIHAYTHPVVGELGDVHEAMLVEALQLYERAVGLDLADAPLVDAVQLWERLPVAPAPPPPHNCAFDVS